MKNLLTLLFCLFTSTILVQAQISPPPPPPPPSPADEVEIFKVVEEMPRFPGCEDISDKNDRKKCANEKMIDYLYANLKYPEVAKNKSIEGMVVLQFVID